MAQKTDLKKKIQLQNMIILALAIIIVVLIIVSTTAAWYIRTKSDSADIILSNPVNIYITEFKDGTDGEGNPIKVHSLKTDILEDYNTRVYPGDNIRLKLGVQMGLPEEDNSPAYVRVKIQITYENIKTGDIGGLSAMGDLVKYKDQPDENNWKLVDFNKFVEVPAGKNVVSDNWYVLKTVNNSGVECAKETQNMEQYVFLDGEIQLDRDKITNEHANCKFYVNYVVEAIQVKNIPDPILHEGYGPWWNDYYGENVESE